MIGAPTFIARSMTLQIFSAYASDSEPPKTVKSWLKTKTSRPSMRAVAGDDAVAEEVLPVEAELGRAMGDEGVELDERARVEQQVEPLARRQLAPGVLPFDPDGSATEQRLRAHLLEPMRSAPRSSARLRLPRSRSAPSLRTDVGTHHRDASIDEAR